MKAAARFADLPPYAPIEPFEVLAARYQRAPEQIIKLDANENPYGPSPRALKALGELRYAHIYPDPESRALRAALAAFSGAPFDSLLAGSGADELLDLLARVLLDPGDGVVVCPPTFGMYSFDTLLNGGRVFEVPRRSDFSLDLPALKDLARKERPKILFLASPNNPDGVLLDKEQLGELLDLPLLVVLDEAYIEFSRESGRLGELKSSLAMPAQVDNLAVLRTFSKWAGLAGLRVGYGAFPGWLLPFLWKAKQPYNVNVAAGAAAIASLQDLDWLAGNVERIKAERERLFELLKQIPYLEPYPSDANFVLCRVKGRPAAGLKERLALEGVFVRYFNNRYLQDYVRISIGRPEDSDYLVGLLERWT